MRSLKASEFKAKCLAVLDDVDRTGESVTILKRGRQVACLIPVPRSSARCPQETLAGTVEILGDIVRPVLPPSAWESNRRKRR